MSRMMKKAAQCLQSTKKIMSRPLPITPKLINNSNANSSLLDIEGIFIIGKNYHANMGRATRHSIFKFDRRHFSTMQGSPKPATLEFTLKRCKPVLVAPAKPTPREMKQVSDIDDQRILRFLVPIIQFYRYDPSMKGKDPARIIREALAQALVFYYPLAGRLREGPGEKLYVDCTGEGILFVEADADVELVHFGDTLRPPFPCFEQLFYNVHGPGEGIVNAPLLIVQVTRLKCGGFIFAIHLNHVMCDGTGLCQFLSAVGEIARGAHVPSINPVWGREILNARDPPRITCIHHEYDKVEDSYAIELNKSEMIDRSFFFGPSELLSIRRFVPQHLHSCSTKFEVLMACLWRCHTIALQLNPKDETRLFCAVNARGKFNPALPMGYYGNAAASLAVVSAGENLCQSSIENALELVKEAKEKVTEEYMHSLADIIVVKGRPLHHLGRSLIVSDLRRTGFGDVDFGWGNAAYSGPPKIGFEGFAFMVANRNKNEEDGILVLLCLEAQTMERFEEELRKMLSLN